eukprot:gnl/TRDRNA2_/TRDRNA2_161429_c0_seq4.p1 gnl/TRDRNA2_/TRDRNA2_161429_c0~~gnl/TRDRNA2_/TRDRNA2_161429_c0_seq4.p1  ORF type:complete len:441 (-),score=46.29 gnl/TRDRNA2_/TRDRNA2_161429_c0_seq4:38-1360(-)
MQFAVAIAVLLLVHCPSSLSMQVYNHKTDICDDTYRTYRVEIEQQEAAISEVLSKFDNKTEKLCEYWGWTRRSSQRPRPRIFYGMLAGNQGQDSVYAMHFAEVYNFVHRIVAGDPEETQLGMPRNLSLNLSSPTLHRFLPKLRQVRLKAGKRPPGKGDWKGYEVQMFQRSQIGEGFKGNSGEWEMQAGDIVIIADSDEIPLKETLAALLECDNPTFSQVKLKINDGENPKEVCAKDAKMILRSQAFEYYLDCPTNKGWFHPDAMLAECLMHGDIDTEDVRTSSSGQTTGPIAARHIHNVGLTIPDIIFKYSHYNEPRKPGLDAGLDVATHQEMQWRACDPTAPDLGPHNWHMSVRAGNDLIMPRGIARGFAKPPEKRVGLDAPFALLADLLTEQPGMTSRFLWKGVNEHSNPYVGKGPGNHSVRVKEGYGPRRVALKAYV